MKLRLDESSARLRLSQSDIVTLQNQGTICTVTGFPGGYLTYRIEITTDAEKVECTLSGSDLLILLPVATAENWLYTDDVGIYAQLAVGSNEKLLELILEKDFPCRHTSADNTSTGFSNLAK